MVLLGLAVTVLGFLLAVLSLGAVSGVGGRLTLVLIGGALTLTGIIGLINRAYLKHAIWKKQGEYR